MKIEEMKDFRPNTNPFKNDSYRMGTYIGKNVIVMMEKFENEIHDYIIVVDITSGKRIKINLAKIE